MKFRTSMIAIVAAVAAIETARQLTSTYTRSRRQAFEVAHLNSPALDHQVRWLVIGQQDLRERIEQMASRQDALISDVDRAIAVQDRHVEALEALTGTLLPPSEDELAQVRLRRPS